MKKESYFYLLIIVLLFFTLSCGSDNNDRREASYVGCYPKGASPSPSVQPVPAGSLNAITFGGYYAGGQGDMSLNCYAERVDQQCVNDCNSCKASCNYNQTCIDQRCYCNCPKYAPGPSVPPSVGTAEEIEGFGWVWSSLPYCSADPYIRATIYEADSDERACACIKDSYWDGSACCGDDQLIPENPPEDNADDPDVKESFCTGCNLGNNIGARAWGQTFCCGDENEDCAIQAKGNICSMDLAFKSPAVYSSSGTKGDIRYIECKDREFLADGSKWIECKGTFDKNQVSEHDYICAKKGKESIYECCGDDQCNSDNTDGKRLKTGQSIKI